jgi:hypothetical protein
MLRQVTVGQATLYPLDKVILAELPWADIHAQAKLRRIDHAQQLCAGGDRFPASTTQPPTQESTRFLQESG